MTNLKFSLANYFLNKNDQNETQNNLNQEIQSNLFYFENPAKTLDFLYQNASSISNQIIFDFKKYYV